MRDLWRRLRLLSFLVPLAIPLISFWLLFPLVSTMPTWDQWSLIPLWDAHYSGRSVTPLLLAPYNGHFNIVPRLFFYGLGILTHWNVRAEVVASYLAAAATALLLIALLPRPQRPGLGWLGWPGWLALTTTLQVFSFLQYENFLSGYPFGQMLAQLLATATVVFVTRQPLGPWSIGAALAAAALASLSWGATIAGWIVGGCALWLGGRRRWALAGWSAVGLAMMALAKSAATGAVTSSWEELPGFFLALLGKPLAWGPFWEPGPCRWLGAANLLIFIVLALLAKRAGKVENLRPWLLLALLALGQAAAIALARSGGRAQQALASHYVTATYPLLLANVVLAATLLAGAAARARRSAQRILAVAALIAVAVIPAAQAIWVSAEILPTLRRWKAIERADAEKIALEIATDEEITRSHHPRPALVRRGVKLLRTHRLAWFAAGPSESAP